MAFGIRVLSPTGSTWLDTSDDTARLGGLRSVAAGNGIISFTVATGKKPFFYAVLPSNMSASWSYASGVFSYTVPQACQVYFGEH